MKMPSLLTLTLLFTATAPLAAQDAPPPAESTPPAASAPAGDPAPAQAAPAPAAEKPPAATTPNKEGPAETPKGSFADASGTMQQQLEESLAELSRLRDQIRDEQVPLSRKLNDLEGELADVRLEYQQTTRLLDSRTLDLSNLTSERKKREDEAAYLTNLLGEYVRNFESGLHIAEKQRYDKALETARLALENTELPRQQLYQAQVAVLDASLDRLGDALGGASFKGTAVAHGLVKAGTFVLVGPAAVFRSDDGQDVGSVEQRLGSLEPNVIPFGTPEDTAAAAQLVSTSEGQFPLDPTLGNAHKVEAVEETLTEHIAKGGPVMYPILALAAASFLVAVYKWIRLAAVRKPSRKRIEALLNAVAHHDEADVRQKVKAIPGPVGQMLATGVEHLHEPRELIEEVMYETVLATRLKVHRLLPFIAISTSSAPLLGLLGTVTGIINTFKLITVFGSGDVKTLSSGISEALITTEFGLIVAIPSLLLYAFLSRKARGIVDQMEKAALAFVNKVSKAPFESAGTPAPDSNPQPAALPGPAA